MPLHERRLIVAAREAKFGVAAGVGLDAFGRNGQIVCGGEVVAVVSGEGTPAQAEWSVGVTDETLEPAARILIDDLSAQRASGTEGIWVPVRLLGKADHARWGAAASAGYRFVGRVVVGVGELAEIAIAQPRLLLVEVAGSEDDVPPIARATRGQLEIERLGIASGRDPV